MNGELEKALLEGEPQAFERLFDRYAVPLARLSFYFLANASEAEDAVQDTLMGFIQALRSGRFHGGNGTLNAYLRSSVSNKCIDRLRKRGVLHLSYEDMGDETIALSAQSDWPSQALDDKRIRQAIERAVQALPPAQRSVIVLRILEEYSYRDIAETLGISLNYVKNLIARARARLSKEIEPFLKG